MFFLVLLRVRVVRVLREFFAISKSVSAIHRRGVREHMKPFFHERTARVKNESRVVYAGGIWMLVCCHLQRRVSLTTATPVSGRRVFLRGGKESETTRERTVDARGTVTRTRADARDRDEARYTKREVEDQ